ncbi:MAG: hypothetical protein HOD58_12165 [Gammaproteobacteria bacterium]|jgi:hypothetical protein|nr:hypothetical protein [Candidatus Neomarinimicrobiota bacterium]MBT4330670.1 hypothetical protein [Gammaproteobacteria bacterium]
MASQSSVKEGVRVDSEVRASKRQVSKKNVSLKDFCMGLSARDSRVELIGAFESQERNLGHEKDEALLFEQRFNKFCNMPV